MNTHELKYNKIRNLFLSQSYQDAWEDYDKSLHKTKFIRWDYVILTASNEDQANSYRVQINRRLEQGFLPQSAKYVVLEDPNGKRVGSGGATLNVLRYLAEDIDAQDNRTSIFADRRILIIHSGGDSKRIPQYSAVGKLFSPVPRVLPDGRPSTLFDELIIGVSGVPSRISEGCLVLSGDALLLINPLQIDVQLSGAAALSIKEPVDTGKNHGVFLGDGHGYVRNFLHKQSEEILRKLGAVNSQNAVDLDTGAILLGAPLLDALLSLISIDGKVDDELFDSFVNEEARVSFYGDFLYPLASDSNLEQFYQEKPEGDYTDALHECRTKIWEKISGFDLKLIALSPARFIHFGTSQELRRLMSEEIDDYEFLGWNKHTVSNTPEEASYSSYMSYVGHRAEVARDVYLEDSYVLGNSQIGQGSIITNVKLCDAVVPDDVVVHGLPLSDGRFVCRVYGVMDNPKEKLVGDTTLWDAPIYPVCDSLEEAVDLSLWLYNTGYTGQGETSISAKYASKDKMSLNDSFNAADVSLILDWQRDLSNRVMSRCFINSIEKGEYVEKALEIFGQEGITQEIFDTLMDDASDSEYSTRIRIYYGLSRYMRLNNVTFIWADVIRYDDLEELCFKEICQVIYKESIGRLSSNDNCRIAKDSVSVELPVRVNFGGGWTDTPPHCMEKGGVVLNAAISLQGLLPIKVNIRRLDTLHIEFESQDIGVYDTFDTIEDIRDCSNPYDSFALHKAALVACGVIPLEGEESLESILGRLGGGIYLSTQADGVPKGSGLGTSSILSGACVKGIFEFLGIEHAESEIFDVVMCMEQIMSTGGGWQDQVGGLKPGFKLISSRPGVRQELTLRSIDIPSKAMEELQSRFALIYTGQRRLARNLLRDVMGGYVGSKPESIAALQDMEKLAYDMADALEAGDIDRFAGLLNRHWELSLQLDNGTTNNCINHIFVCCEDLIDGRFIAGAGGGGFAMVILKQGITKEQLRERLSAIFQNSGVDLWDSEFIL